MAKAAANKFLDDLQAKNSAASKIMDVAAHHLSALASTHGYKFTPEEMEQALVKKWGPPKNREHEDHPFTCCFSEADL